MKIKYSINELILISFISLFLIIPYNLQTIKNRFGFYYQEDLIFYNLIIFLSEILITFCTIFLSFLIINFNQKLLKIFLTILFFLSTVSFYILNKYGTIFDEVMIANSLSSIGHINEVIDYYLTFYLLFGAIIPSIFVAKINISNVKIKTKLLALFIITACLGSCILIAKKETTKQIYTSYSPINYLGSFYKYFQRFHSTQDKVKTRIDLDKIYDFNYNKELENLNVVLILGESLRADHLHINGYKRQTTPNLEKIKNLLNYQVKASFNTTTPSITSILSHRTKADFIDIPPEKSIISVFKNLGFKTYWYSAQSSKEFGNGMLNIMARETDDYFFIDRIRTTLKSNQKVYDEHLLPFFYKILPNKGNKFIVLHSFGSHIRFNERSPEKFKIFRDECIGLASSCEKPLVINSYDNSVFYTDHFISSVISSLKDTNSILFYIADHGVFLGENNIYANGNSDQIDEKIHMVPMFIYMTDSVLKNKNYHKKFINAKSKIGTKNISHDNVFDSIMDCVAIKSNSLKLDLSLCKKSK